MLKRQKQLSRAASITAAAFLILLLILPMRASAITPIPNPQPFPGSYGLAAIKTGPPPPNAATISTPGNGASYSTSPITVGGLCTTGLLVEVFDNGVMVGAIDCTGGSFRLQVSLFTGKNVLTVIQYDDLGQASPVSNSVTVNYNNSHFSAFGELITLTSDYGRRASNPGTALTWPLQLSGGTGPYAFSINWGDGTPAQLQSQELAGVINISHVYNKSGIYHVTITVTDKNGVSAFLQVVAVANGTPTAGSGTSKNLTPIIIYRVVWIPAVIAFILLFPAYWLGRRSELVHLHKQLEKDMSKYNEL